MDSIFLHIAAYRDSELSATLESAFTQAKYPERIFGGIVWQGDTEQIQPPKLRQLPQLKWRYFPAEESEGACWARSKVIQLYGGQDFILQLDSHHRFVSSWDVKLIEMWEQCSHHNIKSLLTAYLPGYQPPNELSNLPAQTLGAVKFEPNGNGFLHLIGRHSLASYQEPQLGQFLSAHFLFGPALFWSEVAYDPELYFQGEEISLAVRAYTHGWDLYYPHYPLCYHRYHRTNRVAHWDEHPSWHAKDVVSKAKVKKMLTGHPVSYGLGNQRSLEDYERFAGLSFKNQTLTQAAIDGRPTKS